MNARATRLAAVLLLLACVAVLAAPVRAQQAGAAGAIAGSVVDEKDGAPLDGVRVTLTGRDGTVANRVTRADGTYEFKDLPQGEYQLDFVKDGYTKSRIAAFPVTPGVDNRADLRLPRGAGAGRARGTARRRGVRRRRHQGRGDRGRARRVGQAGQHAERRGDLEVRGERRRRRAEVRARCLGAEGPVRDHPRSRGPLLERALQRRPDPEPGPRPPVRPARPVPLRGRQRHRRHQDLRARAAQQLVGRVDRHRHARLPGGLRGQGVVGGAAELERQEQVHPLRQRLLGRPRDGQLLERARQRLRPVTRRPRHDHGARGPLQGRSQHADRVRDRERNPAGARAAEEPGRGRRSGPGQGDPYRRPGDRESSV